MIQTGIKLKNIVDFLKEYLSVLIVIPAFIGGIWQGFELMSISIPYIRFFSISQIVSDGILILMFIIIAFSYNFIGWFADILFFEKGKPEPAEVLSAEDYEIYKRKKLRYWLIFFIIFYVFSVVFIYRLFDEKTTLSDFKGLVVSTFFCVFILNRCLDNCYFYAKEKHKEIFKACNILLFVLYFVFALYFSKRIHNLLIAPTNIINIEQVKKDVANKYPNTKQEFLYFNDKYIFIKIIDKIKMDKKGKVLKHTSEKICIMKFETLFDESLKN
ncbi:hypothetical protein [Flavobacterium muglaense]|uniref:Uncharacterized protein n=1 Tax=Flavobacterium muglaense TaxID=2764716 RepID=A0A923MY79_9FLAO|nr:hypothetical protein [Flavobacterium muglaense]MBC5836806.1 hypothetical protein [Flavobacterium muglaense]MBC5843244.1 hypothetical protein [Flavobacterium muglaense]